MDHHIVERRSPDKNQTIIIDGRPVINSRRAYPIPINAQDVILRPKNVLDLLTNLSNSHNIVIILLQVFEIDDSQLQMLSDLFPMVNLLVTSGDDAITEVWPIIPDSYVINPTPSSTSTPTPTSPFKIAYVGPVPIMDIESYTFPQDSYPVPEVTSSQVFLIVCPDAEITDTIVKRLINEGQDRNINTTLINLQFGNYSNKVTQITRRLASKECIILINTATGLATNTERHGIVHDCRLNPDKTLILWNTQYNNLGEEGTVPVLRLTYMATVILPDEDPQPLPYMLIG